MRVNLLIALLVLPLLFTDCANGNKDRNVNKGADPREASPTGYPDFIKLSKLADEKGKIFLQGVDRSDSSGPYIVIDLALDTISFRLLFYPRSGDKNGTDFKAISEGYANNFKDFICFAFVYKMRTKREMKDEHADPTDYPAAVKAYVKKTDAWEILGEGSANNLSELSRLEINWIYKGIQ